MPGMWRDEYLGLHFEYMLRVLVRTRSKGARNTA